MTSFYLQRVKMTIPYYFLTILLLVSLTQHVVVCSSLSPVSTPEFIGVVDKTQTDFYILRTSGSGRKTPSNNSGSSVKTTMNRAKVVVSKTVSTTDITTGSSEYAFPAIPNKIGDHYYRFDILRPGCDATGSTNVQVKKSMSGSIRNSRGYWMNSSGGIELELNIEQDWEGTEYDKYHDASIFGFCLEVSVFRINQQEEHLLVEMKHFDFSIPVTVTTTESNSRKLRGVQ